MTNGQIVQFAFSFACSVPFVWTHATSVRSGGRGCAGFEAWCFNAAFNGALLLLFTNFHVSTYGGGRAEGKGKAAAGGGTGGKRTKRA